MDDKKNNLEKRTFDFAVEVINFLKSMLYFNLEPLTLEFEMFHVKSHYLDYK